LVATERRRWLDQEQDKPVLLLDIPLLFETGAEQMVRHRAIVLAAIQPAAFLGLASRHPHAS
jgi:dephospho-CoA kinase